MVFIFSFNFQFMEAAKYGAASNKLNLQLVFSALRSQQGEACVRNKFSVTIDTFSDTFSLICRLCWHFCMKANWWWSQKAWLAVEAWNDLGEERSRNDDQGGPLSCSRRSPKKILVLDPGKKRKPKFLSLPSVGQGQGPLQFQTKSYGCLPQALWQYPKC